jgi:hypothetical protein
VILLFNEATLNLDDSHEPRVEVHAGLDDVVLGHGPVGTDDGCSRVIQIWLKRRTGLGLQYAPDRIVIE